MVIDATAELKGTITASAQLVGKVSGISNLNGAISIPDSVGSDIETYSGDYTITPKVWSQSFETKNKRMEDDLTVLAIPYYETSNPTGKTVYIGE